MENDTLPPATLNGTTIKFNPFKLTFIDSIPYTIYQYLSFIAVIFSVVTIILSFFRKSRHLEHSTEQILFITFLLTNLIKSIIASALTTNALNLDYDLFNISRAYYSCGIMIVCVYLKFLVFLIILDLIFKAHFGQNYGQGLIYSIACLILLAAVLGLSYFMGSLIFVFKGNWFIIYFKIVITSVQLLSTFSSIFLYYFVKYLRKQSITSSSLSVRHECGKNVLLLKSHFPMVTIDSVIGTWALTISLLGTYVFMFPTNVSFSNYFLYFEITSILTCIHLIWSWHKSGRIGIFKRLTTNCENEASRITVIQTMTSKVPTAQTHDAYFKSLQKSWKK